MSSKEKYRQKAQGRKKKLPEGRIPVRKDIDVQAEWNAFLEQIFSMQELLIWKFYYENGFSCAEIGEKIGISESNTKSSCSECDKN